MRFGSRGPGLGAVVLLAVALTALLRGCSDGGRDGDPEPSAQYGEEATVRVLRVVDGDTIEVDLNGREEDVRYIGIDTPESVAPDQPVECYGHRASDFNASLVDGKTVRLVFDAELRDKYGRLLAYVYVGDVFVNAELVERGLAETLEIEPNTAKADQLGRLEVEASSEGTWALGRLWGLMIGPALRSADAEARLNACVTSFT